MKLLITEKPSVAMEFAKALKINMNRKDEIGDLAKAMDKFADHLQQNVVFNMQQISEGNINFDQVVIDENDEIGPALKKIVETINNLVHEMNLLTASAMEGQLNIRGNEEAFHGAYRQIVQGVNNTLDGVVGPINEAAEAGGLTRVRKFEGAGRNHGWLANSPAWHVCCSRARLCDRKDTYHERY